MGYTRKLTPADRPAIRAHFERLGVEALRLRFGYAVAPATVSRHVDELDFATAILVGHLERGRVRGVLEILPFADTTPRRAELALTVEPDWQGLGCGTEMCRRGLVMACNRGIRRVLMVCLGENVRMQRVANKLDGRVLSRDGEVESEVLLPHPSPWSFAQENGILSGGLIGAALDDLFACDDGAPAPAA